MILDFILEEPIFNSETTFYFYESKSEVELKNKLFTKHNIDNTENLAKGVTYMNNRDCVVCVLVKDFKSICPTAISYLTHEISHVIFSIFEYVGQPVYKDNDEVFAYFMEYLTRESMSKYIEFVNNLKENKNDGDSNRKNNDTEHLNYVNGIKYQTKENKEEESRKIEEPLEKKSSIESTSLTPYRRIKNAIDEIFKSQDLKDYVSGCLSKGYSTNLIKQTVFGKVRTIVSNKVGEKVFEKEFSRNQKLFDYLKEKSNNVTKTQITII